MVINDPTGGDTILIELTPGGSIGSITYTLGNSAPVSLTGVTSFTYNGLGGNDTMTVSKVNGGPLVSGDIVFVCGPGSNTLIVDAEGATVRTTPGVVTFGDPQSIDYTNVSAIEINNASVNSMAGPDTADRAIAFAGLTAQEREIQGLYLTDLGRAGSKAELDNWVAQLAAPNGLQNVTNAIEQSHEGMDHLVKSWYISYLGRSAQGGEEADFVSQLLHGGSESQVLSQILSSSEFYARAQQLISSGSADERYVQALYQVLLNRNGDAPGVQTNTLVVQFAGRQAVATDLPDLGGVPLRPDRRVLHRAVLPSARQPGTQRLGVLRPRPGGPAPQIRDVDRVHDRRVIGGHDPVRHGVREVAHGRRGVARYNTT